ncbi:unnamed protein product [Didymodactylos carnosus]|uniref:Uncharacterized protein n=1 Tax=Didymodactylos carnosus TaxID=1234261 RepID=A0A814KI03_9BILA|nr:unnamed protein product [Didymodactylos carnosus]CAF1051089.1 unnamed protein product [Didymodactylos carnosus]CAF3634370.1 unnamed protein product [Didymodactylos carnosus]CAF3820615.1 unnamed protein product [Didymodactylos carnosus]
MYHPVTTLNHNHFRTVHGSPLISQLKKTRTHIPLQNSNINNSNNNTHIFIPSLFDSTKPSQTTQIVDQDICTLDTNRLSKHNHRNGKQRTALTNHLISSISSENHHAKLVPLSNPNYNTISYSTSSTKLSSLIRPKSSSSIPTIVYSDDNSKNSAFRFINNRSTVATHQQSRPIVENGTYSHSSNNDISQSRIMMRDNILREQYATLINILRTQEIQVKQQQKEITDKQREIEYREVHLSRTERDIKDIQYNIHLLEDRDRYIFDECDKLSHEYSQTQFDYELQQNMKLRHEYDEYNKKIHMCKCLMETKNIAHEQLEQGVKQCRDELDRLQLNMTEQDIRYINNDLEQLITSTSNQEQLLQLSQQRNDDLEYLLNERREQMNDLERELLKLDEILISSLISPCGSNSDMPVQLQFVNRKLKY